MWNQSGQHSSTAGNAVVSHLWWGEGGWSSGWDPSVATCAWSLHVLLVPMKVAPCCVSFVPHPWLRQARIVRVSWPWMKITAMRNNQCKCLSCIVWQVLWYVTCCGWNLNFGSPTSPFNRSTGYTASPIQLMFTWKEKKILWMYSEEFLMQYSN